MEGALGRALPLVLTAVVAESPDLPPPSPPLPPPPARGRVAGTLIAQRPRAQTPTQALSVPWTPRQPSASNRALIAGETWETVTVKADELS